MQNKQLTKYIEYTEKTCTVCTMSMVEMDRNM